LLGVLFAGMAIGVGKILSINRPGIIKGEGYECGIPSQGNTWTQFNVGYYLFSVCFLIFDVEMVFMYPWAVTLTQIGLPALIEIFIFIMFLFMGLLYAFKKKALIWN
ncbi:MAG: NADH-quinone oxidoreductase subunit A, partial [Bacteroidales bacterium]